MKNKEKIKKILLTLSLFVALTFFTESVFAASDVTGRTYNTTMKISDNIRFTSKERLFYKGTNKIMISFDKWNSSICKKATDTSLVTINLYDNINKRTISYKNITTKLNTCGIANFGSQAKSRYIHYFFTYDTNQNKYCGYESNSVVMQSIA